MACRRGEQVWSFVRVPKGRPNLEFELTDDSFGVDPHPPPLAIEENVGVLEISVKQTETRLRVA